MGKQIARLRENWVAWRDVAADRLFGPDAESKRHMSTYPAMMGILLMGVFYTVPGAPTPLLWLGSALLFVAFWISQLAIGQSLNEGRATDLIEWKREEQSLRRGVGALWDRLGRAYSYYGSSEQLEGTLTAVVAEAGWPDRPGPSAPLLTTFLGTCLPNQHATTMANPTLQSALYAEVGLGSKALKEELSVVKNLLEVWAIALDSGGGRAATLKDIIRGLRKRNTNSIRLVYYLIVAHAEHTKMPDPDHDFLRRIREVLLSGLAAENGAESIHPRSMSNKALFGEARRLLGLLEQMLDEADGQQTISIPLSREDADAVRIAASEMIKVRAQLGAEIDQLMTECFARGITQTGLPSPMEISMSDRKGALLAIVEAAEFRQSIPDTEALPHPAPEEGDPGK